MKQRSKQGDVSRAVANAFEATTKPSRKWRAVADDFRAEGRALDKVAMSRKKAQLRHLRQLRNEV